MRDRDGAAAVERGMIDDELRERGRARCSISAARAD